MNIVFFAHPVFLGSQSMPRFTDMLLEGMKRRGCNVKLLLPEPTLYRIPAPSVIRKWLGYIDQYVLFPMQIKKNLKRNDSDTLYVFTDHALGPWVPLVAHRPHVIHCHDFLAQKSASKLVKENPTGFLGRCYQWYIHRGYCKGNYFISVSNKTEQDLRSFLPGRPHKSRVVYNGMNRSLKPHPPAFARSLLSKYTGLDLSGGYVLHVGGNQWYKNRRGVVDIYDAWRSSSKMSVPLIMVGKAPDKKLRERYDHSAFRKDIHPVINLPDELIPFAYSGADVLLFPSLAEGFGWPIAEAMACGCPVITTDARPMTEVAGGAAYLIRMSGEGYADSAFVMEAGRLIEKVLTMTLKERSKLVDAGLINAKRFDTEHSLDLIEKIYQDVLLTHKKKIKNRVAC
jgi:glycosyltransferase involved in cell wall biosynthesis